MNRWLADSRNAMAAPGVYSTVPQKTESFGSCPKSILKLRIVDCYHLIWMTSEEESPRTSHHRDSRYGQKILEMPKKDIKPYSRTFSR